VRAVEDDMLTHKCNIMATIISCLASFTHHRLGVCVVVVVT